MIDQELIKQFVDGFFVILVLFLTWRSFAPATASAPLLDERQTEKWHHELRTLAGTLRELISEASSASGALDRNLVKRQEELHSLLTRADEAQFALREQLLRASKLPARKEDALPKGRHEETPHETLPNETWIDRPRPQTKSASRPARAYASVSEEPADDEGDSLLALLDQKLDSVTVTRSSERSSPMSVQQKPLADAIEVVADEDEDAEGANSLDETTFRIAKRLLLAGQEIHVVARKLDLPPALVRALDNRLQRSGAASTDREPKVEAPARAAPAIRGRAAEIVRQRVTL